ncbi:hypothetical protein HYDPIDRAFT_110284 [Hydnomerulius pinastri MD-312]|nr:hypothetical protein HYDPIDRAFT_110284 [Hydnomerulius pinastri MD-312]
MFAQFFGHNRTTLWLFPASWEDTLTFHRRLFRRSALTFLATYKDLQLGLKQSDIVFESPLWAIARDVVVSDDIIQSGDIHEHDLESHREDYATREWSPKMMHDGGPWPSSAHDVPLYDYTAHASKPQFGFPATPTNTLFNETEHPRSIFAMLGYEYRVEIPGFGVLSAFIALWLLVMAITAYLSLVCPEEQPIEQTRAKVETSVYPIATVEEITLPAAPNNDTDSPEDSAICAPLDNGSDDLQEHQPAMLEVLSGAISILDALPSVDFEALQEELIIEAIRLSTQRSSPSIAKDLQRHLCDVPVVSNPPELLEELNCVSGEPLIFITSSPSSQCQGDFRSSNPGQKSPPTLSTHRTTIMFPEPCVVTPPVPVSLRAFHGSISPPKDPQCSEVCEERKTDDGYLNNTPSLVGDTQDQCTAPEETLADVHPSITSTEGISRILSPIRADSSFMERPEGCELAANDHGYTRDTGEPDVVHLEMHNASILEEPGDEWLATSTSHSSSSDEWVPIESTPMRPQSNEGSSDSEAEDSSEHEELSDSDYARDIMPGQKYKYSVLNRRSADTAISAKSPRIRRARSMGNLLKKQDSSNAGKTGRDDSFWSDQVHVWLDGKKEVYKAPWTADQREGDPFWQETRENETDNWREHSRTSIPRRNVPSAEVNPPRKVEKAENPEAQGDETSIRKRRYSMPPLNIDTADLGTPNLSSNRADRSTDASQMIYVPPQKRAQKMGTRLSSPPLSLASRTYTRSASQFFPFETTPPSNVPVAWMPGCLYLQDPPLEEFKAIDEWWDKYTQLHGSAMRDEGPWTDGGDSIPEWRAKRAEEPDAERSDEELQDAADGEAERAEPSETPCEWRREWQQTAKRPERKRERTDDSQPDVYISWRDKHENDPASRRFVSGHRRSVTFGGT